MPTVTDLEVGPLDARLECAITTSLDQAIDALAVELAGGDKKRARKGFRSRAARQLLTEAVEARRAKEARAQSRSK